MRRLAAAITVLALAGSLVFPSAAVPFSLSHTDAVAQDVALSPTDGPNGDYAHIDDNDELVVDLTAANQNVDGEGVNADGVTTLANVFEIHYNGSRYAHVWITHESEHVTLVTKGDPIESEANNVTLGPNESVAVGLHVDTTGETTEGLIDDIAVQAKVAEPAVRESSSSQSLSISSFEPAESTRRYRITGADYGEAVSLDLRRLVVDRTLDDSTLTLDGLGVTADDRALSLEVSVADASNRAFARATGLEALGTIVVDVEEGDTRGATFRYSVDRAYLDARGLSAEQLLVYRDAGDGTEPQLLETRVVGEREGRIRFVVETPGFSRFLVAARVPDIKIEEVRVDGRSITTGETANVSVVLENRGAAAGSRNVSLSLDGAVVATQNVTLGPGNRTTVTYSVSPSEGEYSVAVDETDAGSLSVASANTSTTQQSATASTTSDDQTTRTSQSTPSASEDSTTTQRQEPSAFEGEDIAGLILFLAIVLGMAFLVRRAPRG